jgi:hypothetical protein
MARRLFFLTFNQNASPDKTLKSNRHLVSKKSCLGLGMINPDLPLGLRYKSLNTKNQYLFFEIRSRATDTEEKVAKPLI